MTTTDSTPGLVPDLLMGCYKPGFYEGQPGQPTGFAAHFARKEEEEVHIAFIITIKCSSRLVPNFGGHTMRNQFVLHTTRTGDDGYTGLESTYDCKRIMPNGKPSRKRQWMTPARLSGDKEYRLVVGSVEFQQWLQDALEFHGFFR